MTVSSRSPLRYPGGKFRARKILETHIPSGTQKIVSPFLGGGSFELHMTSKGIQVESGDVFYLLANFWKAMSENPILLAEEIKPYFGTVDIDKFKTIKDELLQAEKDSIIDEVSEYIDYRLAALFFIVNRCSFSGATLSGGFSRESARTRFTESSIEKVETFHNPLLSVEWKDYKELITGNNDFLFLDPPYLLQNSKNTLYGVSGSYHKSFNHEEFKDVVISSGAPFLLTYNNSEKVRELWKGFEIVEAEWSYGMNRSKESSEIFIKNF